MLCLVGCDAGVTDPGMMMTPPDGSTNEPVVNGKPASQFYGQFTHAVTKAEVSGAAAFPEQADGRNAYLATFFLMPNNELVLFYAEGEGSVSPTGHSLNIITSTKKRREGTWRIDGAALALDSFMRCEGFTFNDKDALRCTLTQSIVTSAASGRAGTFRTGIGLASPDDSEFAEYAP